MKKILIFICIALQFVFADVCKQIKNSEWICKNYENCITRIIFVNNTYYFKIYYPEMKGQTEAVYVEKSTTEEFKKDFILCCRVYIHEHNNGIIGDELTEQCLNMWNDFIYQTNTFDILAILEMVRNSRSTTPLHAMYCMSHNYVRTYDYDEVTGLQINRKDYLNLQTRTYCTEFLTTNKIHWYSNKN